jgi:pantetheine-phosphate adenylyltransferase
MNQAVIYPGSFDPITLGHVDLVQRALRLFDHVIVAVGRGEDKAPLFSVEERVRLIQLTFAHEKRVQVEMFDGLLVNFAKDKNVHTILRGLRVVSDFDYEFQMASMNRSIMPELETIFLTPSDQYTYISSSLVRTVIKHQGDISKFVPPAVAQVIQKKF